MDESHKPPMTFNEAQEAVSHLTAPRVTKESIEAKIGDVQYIFEGLTTICLIEMKSGFKVIGHSTPASPDNYVQTIGQSYAYDNAFRQLWQLEGYLLREKLSEENK